MIGDWASSTVYDIKGKNQPYSEIFAPDEAGVFNDTT